ncbi:MAG TPA: ice-binding family protein [Acidimicrobiales bacterium]|nr:ice-binding family protein [Acidimicrobiales bacterium]
MSSSRLAASAAALAGVLFVLLPGSAGAATAIDLGTARSFAVLAGSGITNTGDTRITGDVGSFPTESMTGFDTVTLIGVNHGGDAVTQDAKNALTTAYNQAFSSSPATSVATELGGRTLTPGVYHSDTLGITGMLTLDLQGDPNAVFVFQANSTLITASASSVVVLGGTSACNVFWQVGSSATFGADSELVGNVLADTSISVGDGATFQGRLLARGGAVTLQHNTITATTCAAAAPASTAGGSTLTTLTPAADGSAADAAAVSVPVTSAAPATPVTTRPAPTTTVTTPRAPTSDGTATGVRRPGLATTGSTTHALTFAGAFVVVLGLLLVRFSRPLPGLRHALPRAGRTAYKESTCR